MTPYVDVKFRGGPRDASIEAAIHRWVARFESMGFAVHRTTATVEPVGRRTSVYLTMSLANATSRSASTARDDAYVAVSDAFREVRRQLLSAAGTQPTSGAPRRMVA